MSKKPTLTQRVTQAEDNVKRLQAAVNLLYGHFNLKIELQPEKLVVTEDDKQDGRSGAER
jgi:hypothetical protein